MFLLELVGEYPIVNLSLHNTVVDVMVTVSTNETENPINLIRIRLDIFFYETVNTVLVFTGINKIS